MRKKIREILEKNGLNPELLPNINTDGIVEELIRYQEKHEQQYDQALKKQTELTQMLQESESRFKTLTNASFGGIAVHDQGVILDFNHSLCDLFAYDEAEIKGMDVLLLIAEQERDHVSNHIKNESEEPYFSIGRSKNGKTFDLEIRAKNIPFQQRTIRVAEFRDISEQKRIENSLEHSRTELMKSLNQLKLREKEISELLAAANTILKSEDFTKTAKHIFDACARSIGARAGYVALLSDDGEENELLFLEDGGMPCTVNPELPMPVRGLRAEAYYSGKVVFDNDFMKSEWVNFMPKGHMALRNVLFSPLNIDGKTVGIMGMACKDGDFNEHDAQLAAAFGDYAAIALQNSRSYQMLQDRAKELKELNATKDLLFSVIAHDLRSPFNSILGYSELLVQKSKDKECEDIDRISRHLNNTAIRSLNLLDNLLEWARVQTGRIHFSPMKHYLNESIEDVVSLLRSAAEKKKIQIHFNFDEIEFVADENMIRAILRNLLSNAIKYSLEGGEINIDVDKKAHDVFITVSDNGIGMTDEIRTKLFQIGNIESMPGTDNETGTGLGLLLCKEFAEQHGGDINVESIKEKGSRFIVRIPIP